MVSIEGEELYSHINVEPLCTQKSDHNACRKFLSVFVLSSSSGLQFCAAKQRNKHEVDVLFFIYEGIKDGC